MLILSKDLQRSLTLWSPEGRFSEQETIELDKPGLSVEVDYTSSIESK